MTSLQESPITFDLKYDTLLQGKSITFTPVRGDSDSPEWSRVALEDGVRIIGMKEVSTVLR